MTFKTNLRYNSRPLNWKFWLWLIAMLIVVIIFVVLSVATLVRLAYKDKVTLSNSQVNMIVNIAEFPRNVQWAIQDLYTMIDSTPFPLLQNRKEVERPSWIRNFPEPLDKGYLLFSGVDAQAKQSAVRLIRIADGSEIASWIPNLEAIHNQTSNKKWEPSRPTSKLRLFHPLLLDSGDIIFNTEGSLVRQGTCSAKPIWVLDELIHHSVELDETGDALWVPAVSEDGFADNPFLKNHIRDDALAHVSINGNILERRSFTRILRDNGLIALMMGTSGTTINQDPIHLNQIKAAKTNTRYWNRGDLLISSRNLSTIFLYRPSTNKILWHQTGPWLNQHSVDFVDSHRISIFSNNIVSGNPDKYHSFLTPNDINRLYIFDFNKNKVSQPYKKLLDVARPITVTEGRAQILSDEGLFIEESNEGRLLRFTKDRLLWSKVNDYDAKKVGILSWSRYLTAEEASVPLKALLAKNCDAGI